MSRHRFLRNLDCDYDDEYYEEDYGDTYEAGKVYSAYDAYEHDVQSFRDPEQEFIQGVKKELKRKSKKKFRFDDMVIVETGKSADHDVPMTVALLLSTVESTKATTESPEKEKKIECRKPKTEKSDVEAKKHVDSDEINSSKLKAAVDAAVLEDDEGHVDESTINTGKERISMVVVGHVDAGKSTLMGHLLVQAGHVPQERSHGVTIDIAQKSFETSRKVITILDSPGHRDFVPNMITGACSADASILVVSARAGEFESGFDSDGQTKEHALLVKALGVNQLIVAVNKLDSTNPPWDKARFDSIVSSMSRYLDKIGFKSNKVKYVAVSGLTGENLVNEPKSLELTSWYRGPTLVDAIDQFSSPPRKVEKPFRMVCSDVRTTSKGVIVNGKILQGRLQQGNKVFVMPIGDLTEVARVEQRGCIVQKVCAGEYIEVTLNIDPSRIYTGNCICKAKTPVPVKRRFSAQVVFLDSLKTPVIRGTEFLLHLQSNEIVSNCHKLIALTTSSGAVTHATPRVVNAGDTCHLELSLEVPICVERYKDCRALGRFVLRQKGKTVGVGFVLDLKK